MLPAYVPFTTSLRTHQNVTPSPESIIVKPEAQPCAPGFCMVDGSLSVMLAISPVMTGTDGPYGFNVMDVAVPCSICLPLPKISHSTAAIATNSSVQPIYSFVRARAMLPDWPSTIKSRWKYETTSRENVTCSTTTCRCCAGYAWLYRCSRLMCSRSRKAGRIQLRRHRLSCHNPRRLMLPFRFDVDSHYAFTSFCAI